ncbi:MAG TPA: right-handed parallel beta-helix repeat-containing protein [Thermoanaerobaculia bacterium]
MTRKPTLCAFLFLIASAAVAQVAVTSSADSGPGSLRQAILDANSGACPSPCLITFGSLPGVTTVEPLTPLPDITAAHVHIRSQPPYRSWSLEISGTKATSGSGLHLHCSDCGVGALIINGFPGSGIVIEDGANVDVSACVIGLDPTGTRAVPNRQNGIAIVRGHNISIGSNTIAGNLGNGIYAVGATNLFLGLNIIGKQYLPQGSGDRIFPNGATGVFLMDVHNASFLGNTIVNNALDGVAVLGTSTGVKIEDPQLPTLIYGNGLLPIDIGFDGVTEEGRPVLSVADTSNGFARVIGAVHAAPNSKVDLNIFASDSLNALRTGDAKTHLNAAKVTTDADGFASFELRFLPRSDITGQWISATATTPAGTSELSAPLQAMANNQNFTVTNTQDSGPGSLRQAILDANAGICSADFPCRVQFDLPAPIPASGHYTIAPLTPLPAIQRSGIIVDGKSTPLPFFFNFEPPIVEINGSRSTPGAGLTIAADNGPIVSVAIRRLAINGFNGPGILIDSTAGNYVLNPVIANNVIGTDPTGTIAVPNLGDGILVRGDVPFVHIGTYGSGNRIQGNLISGNLSNGVMLVSGFFEFEQNRIGTDVTRKVPIPNGRAGVDVEATAGSHLEGNTIAFNGTVGISTVMTTPQAFKGAVQNSIHSNTGLAIELRDAALAAVDLPRQTPPEITSATFDPATGITTIAGTFTRVSTPSGWTTTLDFASSTFPESGGRGSMETPLYVNLSTLKDEGQGRFSFNFTARQVDLRGKRISATATPFIYQGFKAPPTADIFGQGFEYGTTSEVSKAVPVVTLGCSADQPQISEASSSGELRWSTVAGATSYNVWLRSVPGVPRIIATTSGASTTVSLERGKYEWFVEALFPQCPSVKSEAATLVVKPGRKRVVSR